MDLAAHFIESWKSWGTQTLVSDEMREINLDSLARSAAHLAIIINQRDTTQEKRVACLLPNTLGFPISMIASWFSRRTFVPLNFLLPAKTLAEMLADCGARLILTATHFKPLVEETQKILGEQLHPVYLDQMAARIPAWIRRIILAKYTPQKIQSTLEAISPDDVAVILYTSGTEGSNKGVMLTHGNLVSNYQGTRTALNITDQDSLLCVLPTFHSFALTKGMIIPLMTGARICMMKKFTPDPVLQLIEEKQITYIILVPAMYALLSHSTRIKNINFSQVKMCVSGGGPLDSSVSDEFEAKTGLKIYNGYGLTETSPGVSVNRPNAIRPGSVGVPLPNIQIQIWDDKDNPCPMGDVGEIMVKGPNVMKGYLNDAEATARTINPDGWLHTGDLGRVDQDGYLFVTGRKKELIITSGKNIYPLEIETVILHHPAVEEVAVIGIEDKIRGEYPKAFIKVKPEMHAREKDIREFCIGRLPAYMVPREIEFLAEFPKTPLGKIQKHLLPRHPTSK